MILENLPELAEKSFTLALVNCADCCSYHATWGYLRAAGFRRGAGADRTVITTRLASLRPNPRILVVGSADTGQVATLANALAGRDFTITLVDICDTPLQLCAGFAAQNGIRLETWRRDIRDIDSLRKFDAILLHNFIGFISASERVKVLSDLRSALAERGRLLVFQWVYGDSEHKIAKAPDAELAAEIIDELRSRAIKLPESPKSFAARLLSALASTERESRGKAFKTVGDVQELLCQAGFGEVVTTRLGSAADRDNKATSWRPPNERYLYEAC